MRARFHFNQLSRRVDRGIREELLAFSSRQIFQFLGIVAPRVDEFRDEPALQLIERCSKRAVFDFVAHVSSGFRTKSPLGSWTETRAMQHAAAATRHMARSIEI